MSVAYEAGGLSLARKERRSVSPKVWLLVGQLVLLAVAIPGAIVLGALLP
jgi:hypothetical protein